MSWQVWTVVALTGVAGVWMAYDGARALTVGDYTTPQSGPYAGQLGPWSKLVSAVGIEPRSTLMKTVFVVLGLSGFAAATAGALGAGWGRYALAAFAVLTLWYLPVGTAVSIANLGLLGWASRIPA